jgi:hypothetical protein
MERKTTWMNEYLMECPNKSWKMNKERGIG